MLEIWKIKIVLIIAVSSVIGISIMTCSCKKSAKDDVISLQKRPYNGNQLKINGYYYCMTGDVLHSTYFFYNNGIIIHGGGNGPYTPPLEFIESQFISESYLKSIHNTKSSWGVFQIDGSSIKFERWFCSNGYCKTYIREGTILNDSTFIITKLMRSDGSEKADINETFHFKEFAPKPDSLNIYGL